MRKSTKIMMHIASAFAIVGLGMLIGGVCAGAAGTGENSLTQLKNMVASSSFPGASLIKTGMEYTFSGNKDWDDSITSSVEMPFPEELVVDLKFDELILQEYAGNVVKIETVNDASGDVFTEGDAKKLIIKDTHKNSRRSKQIKVWIPAGREFKRVEFSVEAGTIEIDSDLKTETFVAEIGAGEFYCEGEIRAEECRLDVGAGSIETERITAKKISGDCGTGEIDMELAGKESDYDYELSCGIGEIDLGDEEYSGLGIERTIENKGSSGKVILNCGMGEIDVTFAQDE